MKKYYSGVGSRNTPFEITNVMTDIASLLEEKGYILRSGHANGADLAFENGVYDKRNMKIYLPYEGFNGGRSSNDGFIYVEDDITNEDYVRAYESLKYHPKKYKMTHSTKIMMIRNYFQVHGINNEPSSMFNICWTEDGKMVGGTAQSIRLCNAANIPVYNLGSMFIDWDAKSIVDEIL